MNKSLLERVGVLSATYGDLVYFTDKAVESEMLAKEIEIAILRVPKLGQVKYLLEKELIIAVNDGNAYRARVEVAKQQVLDEVSRVSEEMQGG